MVAASAVLVVASAAAVVVERSFSSRYACGRSSPSSASPRRSSSADNEMQVRVGERKRQRERERLESAHPHVLSGPDRQAPGPFVVRTFLSFFPQRQLESILFLIESKSFD